MRRWLISVFVLLAVMTVSGQDAGRPVPRPNEQTPVFSSAAELVAVHVTVTDRRGAYVTSLPRDAVGHLSDTPLPWQEGNAALAGHRDLITCYPFDFVGPAPRRFVVHAERIVETNEARALSADDERGDGAR
jgi:hypothetical protein